MFVKMRCCALYKAVFLFRLHNKTYAALIKIFCGIIIKFYLASLKTLDFKRMIELMYQRTRK